MEFSPCDFFVFPILKRPLFARRYESQNAIDGADPDFFYRIPFAVSGNGNQLLRWRLNEPGDLFSLLHSAM